MTSPTTLVPRAAATVCDDDAARRTARRRVYDLVRSAQLEGGLTSQDVEDLIADGRAHGWADVVKLGMFLGMFHAQFVQRDSGEEQIEALLTRAEHDGDAVMTALALGARAQDRAITGGRAPVDADRDLARATVLLEGWTGPSSEAASAHIECAYACECRDLWELQLRHYEAAEACLDWEENAAERLEVLLYNRAETEVTWLAALRERGPSPELHQRAEHARRALEAADLPSMPASWRDDLHVFRELVDAIAPPVAGAPPSTRPAAGRYAGFIHLCRALTADDPAIALAHCERAIEVIDPVTTNRIHLVSLALAVELESTLAGRETAALRWGRELVARRWERRLAALASLESLVEIERRAAEHALLTQHAYLDDLTGLANRRALARFVDGHRGRGTTAVAVALVDLDHFKLINDRHGHATGDEVLVRIAAILRSAVRDEDLVVRLGGDEFLLAFAVHGPDIARRRCDTIVDRIDGAEWAEIGPELSVTASLGLAHGSLDEFEALTAAADVALYRAKQTGGTQLVVSPPAASAAVRDRYRERRLAS